MNESVESEVFVMPGSTALPCAGQPTAVIVPIEMWREIEAERETDYPLKSENMKRRLLASLASEENFAFEAFLRSLEFESRGFEDLAWWIEHDRAQAPANHSIDTRGPA